MTSPESRCGLCGLLGHAGATGRQFGGTGAPGRVGQRGRSPRPQASGTAGPGQPLHPGPPFLKVNLTSRPDSAPLDDTALGGDRESPSLLGFPETSFQQTCPHRPLAQIGPGCGSPTSTLLTFRADTSVLGTVLCMGGNGQCPMSPGCQERPSLRTPGPKPSHPNVTCKNAETRRCERSLSV